MTVSAADSARDYHIAREWEISCRRRVADFQYLQQISDPQARDEFAQAHGFVDASENEVLRAWWAACGDVLHKLAVAKAIDPEFGASPLDLFSVIAGLARYIAVGDIPAVITNAASKGRPSAGPTEANDIALAVAYIKAARGQLVHLGETVNLVDRAAVTTVARQYGVDASTVRRWQRNHVDAFLGIQPIDGEFLANKMRQAGERYTKAGRSTKAQFHRAAKRAGSK